MKDIRHVSIWQMQVLVPGLGKSNLRMSQNYAYISGGPHNKDYSILGSIWGPPILEKLPYEEH